MSTHNTRKQANAHEQAAAQAIRDAEEGTNMSDSKPVLMCCQICGCEPECASFDNDAGKGVTIACKCDSVFLSVQYWNFIQFKARHEAIDKLVLAILAGVYTRELVGDWGDEDETWSDIAAKYHEFNLARRRAEAIKLLEGGE